jgi:hypothetical protein
VSLIVSFMVGQRRLRAEVARKVIEFLQELDRTMEVFLVQRASDLAPTPRSSPRRYRDAKLRLRAIVLNDVLRAEVGIVFGEGEDLQLLTEAARRGSCARRREHRGHNSRHNAPSRRLAATKEAR